MKTVIPEIEVKKISDSLNYVHLGTVFGSISPKTEQFLPLVFEIMEQLGLKKIFSPVTNFTNKIVGADTDGKEWENRRKEQLIIARSAKFADGVTAPKEKGIGLIIANADCPLVVMESEKVFTLLHAGLKCIYRDDSSISIIDVSFWRYHRDQNPMSKIWVGAGIGPCCYGLKDNDLAIKLTRRYGFGFSSNKVRFGPRKGQEPIDLFNIIRTQIEECLTAFYWPGADKRPAVKFNKTCTSCLGMKNKKNAPGFGKFFSNVRDTEKTGARNLFLVFPA